MVVKIVVTTSIQGVNLELRAVKTKERSSSELDSAKCQRLNPVDGGIDRIPAPDKMTYFGPDSCPATFVVFCRRAEEEKGRPDEQNDKKSTIWMPEPWLLHEIRP